MDDDIQAGPIPSESPRSIELSGPHEPSNSQSTSQSSPKTKKGKDKMPEYEDDQSDSNE